MASNSVDSTVNGLLKGMEGFISSKTVVGEPMNVKDMIIIPLSEVSFAAGAGAFDTEKKDNCGGGIGGKVAPTALLVIQNGTSKLVSLKDRDVLSKLLDMVPDLINKFMDKTGKKKEDSFEEE